MTGCKDPSGCPVCSASDDRMLGRVIRHRTEGVWSAVKGIDREGHSVLVTFGRWMLACDWTLASPPGRLVAKVVF